MVSAMGGREFCYTTPSVTLEVQFTLGASEAALTLLEKAVTDVKQQIAQATYE